MPYLDGWPGRQGDRVDDSGRFHFEFDRAVLLQVPVGTVLVVPHGADGGDHQFPPAAHFGVLCAEVPVLPQDAVILLVDTDGVFDDDDLAIHRIQFGIEIGDVAQAVAAQLQRIRQLADAILADIKDVLAIVPIVRGNRTHHHLDQRRPMHDRTAIIGDLVQGNALAGV